jgi:hypothetical protein
MADVHQQPAAVRLCSQVHITVQCCSPLYGDVAVQPDVHVRMYMRTVQEALRHVHKVTPGDGLQKRRCRSEHMQTHATQTPLLAAHEGETRGVYSHA